MAKLIYITLFFIGSLSAVSQDLSEEVLLLSNTENGFYTSKLNNKTSNSLSDVDLYALSIKAEDFNSYHDLTKQLIKQCDNQYEQVRSIYAWIAGNITYHEHTLKTQSQSSDAVWRSQKAVCEGYANLFNAMCREAGIESRMVKGYVRNYSGADLKFPNHAWNSVFVNGKWQLLDVTWASVNTRTEIMGSDLFNEMYRKHKLNHFFMVDPEKMILTHLPEDPFWQLQGNRIDFDTFEKGEGFVSDIIRNGSVEDDVNFENLIAKYENLDSLDQAISYLERMVDNKKNSVKEYGLGVAYFYKAQGILNTESIHNIYSHQQVKDRAREYYQKSLEYLSMIEEDDFGYDFSQDFVNNVMFRMEVLQ